MCRENMGTVDEGITEALERVLDGELRAIGAAIQALPEQHPRRRILLANYRQALALLTDMPRILAR